MASEKDSAKAKKKKAKTKAKAEKKKAKTQKKPKETIIIKEETKKDWRSNIWLYILVAIIVGLTVWFITTQLGRFFR